VKLTKQADCEKNICLYSNNFTKIPEDEFKAVRSIETLLLSFDRDLAIYDKYLPITDISAENGLLTDITVLPVNLDINKLKQYYNLNNDMCLELVKINKYFSNVQDNGTNRLKTWLFYIYSKFLIFLSLDHNFCFNMLYTKEFVAYFKYFHDYKLETSVDAFEELRYSKNDFLSIINNYQNFLTLLLFNIGESEFRQDESIEVLIHFMELFQLIYEVNEKFSIVSYKEFYNESINKNLNIKEECRVFFKSMRKNDKSAFSLIKYHWLFDPAVKSDILTLYNFNLQRYEVINSIGDLMGDLNLFNPMNMYLLLEIRRNNLLEETLNFISNPEHNFKKQLKVRFIGEQGIDEGGVKKEFFMLLVRHLFDPDYGMFTYNEVILRLNDLEKQILLV
jgi:hypothetical protein